MSYMLIQDFPYQFLIKAWPGHHRHIVSHTGRQPVDGWWTERKPFFIILDRIAAIIPIDSALVSYCIRFILTVILIFVFRLEHIILSSKTTKIRSFLQKHRRVLHMMFGKNAWNDKKGYSKDLRAVLDILSSVTNNILYLGCINTSDASEYMRPGFRDDIFKFNKISENIIKEKGFDYFDLNAALTCSKYPYEEISHEGIHYTDKGDDVIAEIIFYKYLEKLLSKTNH